MLVGREHIAQIGAVKDVLEGWQHLDPDMRSVFGRDESVGGANG